MDLAAVEATLGRMAELLDAAGVHDWASAMRLMRDDARAEPAAAAARIASVLAGAGSLHDVVLVREGRTLVAENRELDALRARLQALCHLPAAAPRAIKLMADYQCFPLWEASAGCQGNVDPCSLPLSEALRDELLAWARRYDATLDDEDPIASGFDDPVQERIFKQEGLRLADRLREELGPGFTLVVRV